MTTALNLLSGGAAQGIGFAIAKQLKESGATVHLADVNAEALAQTLASRKATFWSRSRRALWVKGETSGNFLHLVEARIDCDQDAIWLKCRPQGPACHTGADSCFFRIVERRVLRPC